jgi:hypothetical protein
MHQEFSTFVKSFDAFLVEALRIVLPLVQADLSVRLTDRKDLQSQALAEGEVDFAYELKMEIDELQIEIDTAAKWLNEIKTTTTIKDREWLHSYLSDIVVEDRRLLDFVISLGRLVGEIVTFEELWPNLSSEVQNMVFPQTD